MSRASGSVADATGNWVDTLAPAWSRPYLRLARLDRPIGSWLLLMPCWWSCALAAIAAGNATPRLTHLALFFLGAFAMRGAGCTWNDIVDRDLDRSVERTRSRPIPSGQVSVAQAVAFLVLQSLIGLAVLLSFNVFTVGLGVASLAIVAVYPFMKRITYWPQIVLGLAFSWGALMGWAAAFGRLDPPALPPLRRIDRLGDRLRHDLRPSGSRGRCAHRHQVHGAPFRRTHQADARGVLHACCGAHRRRRIGGRRRRRSSPSASSPSPHTSRGRSFVSTSPIRTSASTLFKSDRDAGLILFAGLLADAAVRRLV